MNSRLKTHTSINSKYVPSKDYKEPDRIGNTTKIRTFVRCGSLFSEESTIEKLQKRALLCSEEQEETKQKRLYKKY